jgi:hypothetical protein
MGLPECGFVFCCFNNNWKIASEVFDIWIRDSESAEKNLGKGGTGARDSHRLWCLRDGCRREDTAICL